MKVIGITGSLRSRSNTLLYVENALEVFDAKGFDTELINAVADAISIPVIASSGAGKVEHFQEVFTVTEEHAAAHVGSGSMRVLSSPWMIAFMEITAR